MNNFYAQYKYIEPYLKRKQDDVDAPGVKESFLQSPADRAKLVRIWKRDNCSFTVTFSGNATFFVEIVKCM